MSRLLLVIVWCFITVLEASEKQLDELSISLTQVPGIMEPDSTDAPYNRLLQHIIAQSPFTITTEYLPYTRGENLLQSNEVDCMFPVVIGEPRESFATVYSEAVNVVSVYIFSLENSYRSLADIAGKTVIYLDGYSFGYWSLAGKEKVVWVKVGTQENALKVLQSGRAAAYIDYYPDIKLSLDKQDFERLKFSYAHPLKSAEDSFECFVSQKNKLFIQWLNREISTLKKSGGMRVLLTDYYNNE